MQKCTFIFEYLLIYYLYSFSAGRWAILKVELSMKRKIGFYFLQVFIPSIFLVVLSWLSFWVDASAVPARVSLGVTCVLTMTTQSSGIRQTLPPVSYAKAIDVWMFVCLLFVFAALLEFAYVNVVNRRKPSKAKDGSAKKDVRKLLPTCLITLFPKINRILYFEIGNQTKCNFIH